MKMPLTIKQACWRNDKALLQKLRKDVFIIEQGIAIADEWDEYDNDAQHYIAWLEHQAIGCARVILTSPTAAKIGRVAIIKSQRKQGYATLLMQALMQTLQAQGIEQLALDAQLYICDFYSALGFTAEGPVFLDAGIEHRKMHYRFSTSQA